MFEAQLRPTLSPALVAGIGARTKGVWFPAGTIFVSKSATNGFGVGSDSYSAAQAQDRDTPFATIDKAVRTVANGGFIVANDGDYSSTELGTGGVLLFEGNTIRTCTIRAYHRGAVRFIGTDATYVVRVSNLASAGLSIILDGIDLDADNVSSYCVGDTGSNGNARTIILRHCKLTNPTIRGVQVASAPWAYELDDIEHVAGASRNMFYTTTATGDCSLVVRGGSSTVTQQNNNSGIIQVDCTGAGVSVDIDGLAMDSTFHASSPASGSGDGIRILGASTVSIKNCDVSVVGLVGTRGCACIRVSPNGAWAMAVQVTNNRTHHGTINGYDILVGTDGTGTGDGYIVDPIVNDNTVTADPAGQQSAIHGVMLGFTTRGETLRNAVSGCALAMIHKRTIGPTLAALNTIRLEDVANVAYAIAMYSKGSDGARWYHNSIYVDDEGTDPVYIAHMQPDDNSPFTDATNSDYKNNAVYSTNTDTIKFVNADPDATGVFGGNVYFSTDSLASNAWEYDSVSYPTIAAWQGAEEPSAMFGDQAFVDAANDDFHLGAGSAAIAAGAAVSGVPLDRDGMAFASPPSAGAYEYAA